MPALSSCKKPNILEFKINVAMIRSNNLTEFTRDHHRGLSLSWKIRQGIKNRVELNELVKYTIHYACEALFPHFAEEENQVLIHLSPDDIYRKRTIAEHLEIIALIEQLGIDGNANEGLLLKLADKAEEHIRFEERELFPYMESKLSAGQLDEIGKLISELHQPFVETFNNKFWVS